MLRLEDFRKRSCDSRDPDTRALVVCTQVSRFRVMNSQVYNDSTLFAHAPPMAVQRRLGLARPDQLHAGRRALLVVLIGWVPIVLLTLVQVALRGDDGITSLLFETGAHARYLVAAPLLIIAEGQCATRLGATVRTFIEAGLVPDARRAELEAAVASTRRLLDSTAAEIAAFALAYLVAVLSVVSYLPEEIPVWHKSAGIVPGYSAAGWWHVLVSLPLLLVLIFGWLWRLALWARLLWLISRLDLRLIASHPDHAAGLGFVGHSLSAFSIVALALATIAAGRSAHLVLLDGALPTPYLLFNLGFLAFLLALFVAPLLVFTPMLLLVWQRGTIEYGALAVRIGEAFEGRWLDRGGSVDRAALEKPDFSATADLYSVASNVGAIRFVPFDLKNLIALTIALLLPFGPVVLLAIPIKTILQSLQKLLF